MIYLRHPVHGTKVATLDMEAKADEENGWVRYEPGEPQAPATEAANTMRRRARAPRRQVSDDDSGRSD